MSDPDDMDAALFAAGALSAAETAALKERLKADPALSASARDWEEALAPLAALAGALEPPAGLFDQLEARIEARDKLTRLSRTLRAGEGDWIAMAPGVRFKELSRNAEARRWTILVDADAGATFPAHEHAQDEELFLISGDLAFGDVELGPGDFYFSPRGSLHEEHSTRAGCRCLIVQAM